MNTQPVGGQTSETIRHAANKPEGRQQKPYVETVNKSKSGP